MNWLILEFFIQIFRPPITEVLEQAAADKGATVDFQPRILGSRFLGEGPLVAAAFVFC